MTDLGPPRWSHARLRGFRCLHDVTLPLAPLTALIGPNESGKSTLLAALHILALRGRLEPPADAQVHTLAPGDAAPVLGPPPHGAYLVKLEPSALREPVPALEDHRAVPTWEPTGLGLALLYDAVRLEAPHMFEDLERDLAELHPGIAGLDLEALGPTQRVLGVRTVYGRSLPPEAVGDGLLLWLGFRALLFLEPAPLVLVEHPERSLHPARLWEIMRLFRMVSEQSTGVLTTHSPRVLDELEGQEIVLVTRDPNTGTQALRLCDTNNYDKRRVVFKPGELWVEYCDGVTEENLRGGG